MGIPILHPDSSRVQSMLLPRWVKILYKEPKAAVITNGIISPFFGLSRGTHQGYSLSPLLFIIFLESLAASN